jgi:hypothetical protein
VDFGAVSIFDTATVAVKTHNDGSDTLVVSRVIGTDAMFCVQSTLPLYVAPQDSASMILGFHNATKGIYNRTLTVVHNDAPNNPAYLNLSATSFAPNRLHVVSTSGLQYGSIGLPFAISNTEQFVGFQFDVTLPTEIVFQPNTVQLSSRAQGHTVSSSVLPNGDVRIIAFSFSQSPFVGDSGEVVRFNVYLGGDSGTFPIELKNVVIGNAANQNIASGFDDGTVTIIAPPVAPQLIAPANHAIHQPIALTFIWDGGAESESYRLQVAADSTFSTPAFDDSSLTSTSIQVGPLSNLTTYYWRVKGKNVAGWGPYSPVWNFTTLPPPPAQVSLLLPADDAVISSDSVFFIWNVSSPQVDRYWFEIATDSLFASRVVDSTLTDTTKLLHQFINNQKYWWKVRAGNVAGWGEFSAIRSFRVLITSVREISDLPLEYVLLQNYPNPFNPTTTIEYQLPEDGHVRLGVFDILGREVASLVNQPEQAGTYMIPFDAGRLASGVYFYRIEAGLLTSVKKMLVLK